MRWYDLGGSWAVSAAGTARIIHASCKDHRLHDDAPIQRTAQEEHTEVIVTTSRTESHASPISIAASAGT